MAEPPSKRARRPDSKQMWDDSDRCAPTGPRPRQEPNDRREGRDRERDRSRERDRRYRSRSPRDSRRNRDRGGREPERDSNRPRELERRGGRGRDERGGRRDGDRNSRRDGDRNRERDGGRDTRDRPRERSRERDRAPGKRDDRSRSPRRERERDDKGTKDLVVGASKPVTVEEGFEKSRTATPPVSFKVGPSTSPPRDHDRMDVDVDSQAKKAGRKGKKGKIEELVEDDDEIIVEDDGMDAMKAMMGFGGFSTTHQKKVPGNDIYAVRKEKKTEYRQYMNRVGGFNRPLSPTRES